jgi:hypothetical protein
MLDNVRCRFNVDLMLPGPDSMIMGTNHWGSTPMASGPWHLAGNKPETPEAPPAEAPAETPTVPLVPKPSGAPTVTPQPNPAGEVLPPQPGEVCLSSQGPISLILTAQGTVECSNGSNANRKVAPRTILGTFPGGKVAAPSSDHDFKWGFSSPKAQAWLENIRFLIVSFVIYCSLRLSQLFIARLGQLSCTLLFISSLAMGQTLSGCVEASERFRGGHAG